MVKTFLFTAPTPTLTANATSAIVAVDVSSAEEINPTDKMSVATKIPAISLLTD